MAAVGGVGADSARSQAELADVSEGEEGHRVGQMLAELRVLADWDTHALRETTRALPGSLLVDVLCLALLEQSIRLLPDRNDRADWSVELPDDPWEEGNPVAAMLDETAMLAIQLEHMRNFDEITRAVWALDIGDLRALALERALTAVVARRQRHTE